MDELTVVYPVLLRPTRQQFSQEAMAPTDPRRADYYREVVLTRHDTACAELMTQFEHLSLKGESPRHVIFGRDFFNRFMDENLDIPATKLTTPDSWSDAIRMTEYTGEFKWPGQPDYRQVGVFCGISVHLIPWMVGVIVLPDLCGCVRDRRRAVTTRLLVDLPVDPIEGYVEPKLFQEVKALLMGAARKWMSGTLQKHLLVRPAYQALTWMQ